MDDDVFSAVVLGKLPLADSVWRLLHFTRVDSRKVAVAFGPR
jgi:hypothetical protein